MALSYEVQASFCLSGHIIYTAEMRRVSRVYNDIVGTRLQVQNTSPKYSLTTNSGKWIRSREVGIKRRVTQYELCESDGIFMIPLKCCYVAKKKGFNAQISRTGIGVTTQLAHVRSWTSRVQHEAVLRTSAYLSDLTDWGSPGGGGREGEKLVG